MDGGEAGWQFLFFSLFFLSEIQFFVTCLKCLSSILSVFLCLPALRIVSILLLSFIFGQSVGVGGRVRVRVDNETD